MRVAYLVNQYPMTSLSFIRREIHCLESLGVEVERFALRPWAEALVDPLEQEEFGKTRFVQRAGLLSGCWAVLRALVARPVRFLRALALALRSAWSSDRNVAMHLAYLAEAAILQRWLARAPVDHLHAHFSSNSTDVAMLCRELGGPPYSFTVHGPEEIDRAAYLGLAEKVSRAVFVAAISDFCRSQLMRWCDARDWSKLRVVRCALQDDYFEGAVALPAASRRLVNVGRLSEQKGHLVLLEAAGRLRREGLDFELVILGDGPLRSPLEARLAELGLEDAVRLAGWATGAEVRRQLAEARALVLPSFAEGLPVVIMEAFALHRPVISTYVAGIPELVEAGASGWLVPAGNVERLVEAMREALTLPVARLEAMGRVGAQATWERHRLRVEAAKLVEAFRSGAPVPD